MGTGTLPRPSDLLIREQQDLALLESPDGDGVFNADGTVNMVIIRPCNGRGQGQRIYEADVLSREAAKFKGWSMFDNHDSPAARKGRQGLPRPVSELAGVIRESFWDPDFTSDEDTERGYGQGAVIGRCKLTPIMESLVREIPEAIKGSLNAQATSMRMGSRNGKKGWIVEGIEDDPENSSFDLVTKAGAGGRVRSLLESLYDGPNATGGNRDGEIDMGGMTLQEALATDEVKTFIGAQIQEGISEALPGAIAEAVAERETELRQEIRDELGQTNRLRGLHAEALRLIEAAKLPSTAKAALLEDYGLTDEDDDTVTAGRSLALIEAEVDGEGKVTKPAKAVLKESIDSDVARVRNMLREAAPTVPLAPGGGGDSPVGGAEFGGQGSDWAERVKARGLDPKMFGASQPATTAASE